MTWTQDPRSYPNWNVERTGSTRRITQDGRVRIIEAGAVVGTGGNVRIIERFEIKWSIEPSTSNPWTQE